jgi:Ca2+-binding RTX toxin-like protein
MALITVTTGSDVVNAFDGVTSLREAVTQAQASSGADTINFDASVGTVVLIDKLTFAADTFGNITIDGGSSVVIDGGFPIVVAAVADVRLTNLSLTGDFGASERNAPGQGGLPAPAVIDNSGFLALENVTVRNVTSQAGAPGSNPEPGAIGTAGANDSPGGRGGDGVDGGDGGASGLIVNRAGGYLDAISVAFSGNNVSGAVGGWGAPGGQGGAGGPTTLPGPRVPQSGGNGGDGGDGGDAALILNYGSIEVGEVASNGDTILGGPGGAGAPGGPGGAGGTILIPSTISQPGQAGQAGENGEGFVLADRSDAVLSLYDGPVDDANLLTALTADYYVQGYFSSFVSQLTDGQSLVLRSPGAWNHGAVAVSGDDVLIDVTGAVTATFNLTGAAREITLGGNAKLDVNATKFADIVHGNDGANRIIGFSGADSLTGGAGNDSLIGGLGVDTMEGGLGNDHLTVNDAGDVVRENVGEGTDTVLVYADWTGTANQSIEIIRAAKSGLHVSGNELANRLYGTAGVDHLSGGGGADILYDGETSERHYSEPRDTLAGGEGNDRYYVNSYLTIVEEDAEGGADRVYAACDYQLLDNVEQLYANTTNDVHLSGNDGANVIVGGSGDNEIAGGGGPDLLTGGAGADTFVFIDYGLDTADRVMDFEAGVDKIEFRPIYRDFAPEDFKVIGGGTRGVVDADDRVIYNASTGQLFYDSNGASDGARELIATFTGKPAIGYGDFILGELP